MSLKKYHQKVEEALRKSVLEMGEKNRLREACEYCLFSKGKRVRPIIVLMIADALGKGFDVMPSALSVEFFHTASLIADDLPCMDDDDFRRNKPSLHKAFDEATALLASYTLIAEGYGSIYRNEALFFDRSKNLEESCLVLREALKSATFCGGLKGGTGGQYIDLFPPDFSWQTVQKVIYQKTIVLFELSFILGWIFGGGDLKRLQEVKDCAYHLGLAFQLKDDLDDEDQDEKEKMSSIKSIGKEGALALFQKEKKLFREDLERLGLWTKPFQELYDRF